MYLLLLLWLDPVKARLNKLHAITPLISLFSAFSFLQNAEMALLHVFCFFESKSQGENYYGWILIHSM